MYICTITVSKIVKPQFTHELFVFKVIRELIPVARDSVESNPICVNMVRDGQDY